MTNKLLKRISFLLTSPEERRNKSVNLTQENCARVSSLKNKYQGKRCFIIGSSPSIKQFDLFKLNDEYTFTVNRGYMLSENGLMHSSFHVISDIKTFQDQGTKFELMKNFSDKLFCYAGMKPPVKMDTYYFDYTLSELNKEIAFQEDLTKPLIAYLSVIHFAIQIAYYLGFDEMFLLGVDLDFANIPGHAYLETVGEKKREISTSVLNAEKMLLGLQKCAYYLNKNKVKIANASLRGVVDCMPRVKFEELFN